MQVSLSCLWPLPHLGLKSRKTLPFSFPTITGFFFLLKSRKYKHRQRNVKARNSKWLVTPKAKISPLSDWSKTQGSWSFLSCVHPRQPCIQSGFPHLPSKSSFTLCHHPQSQAFSVPPSAPWLPSSVPHTPSLVYNPKPRQEDHCKPKATTHCYVVSLGTA